ATATAATNPSSKQNRSKSNSSPGWPTSSPTTHYAPSSARRSNGRLVAKASANSGDENSAASSSASATSTSSATSPRGNTSFAGKRSRRSSSAPGRRLIHSSTKPGDPRPLPRLLGDRALPCDRRRVLAKFFDRVWQDGGVIVAVTPREPFRR